MANSTAFYANGTPSSIQDNKTSTHIKTALMVVMFLCFFFFLYFILVILSAFFTTAQIRENARYILFAHMLVNDTLYLGLGIILFMANVHVLYVPGPVCFWLYELSSSTFRNTPYNLAVMSLERYVAICLPLRHAELCTCQRAYAAIGVVWSLGFIPNVAEMFLMGSSLKNFFSISVLCTQEVLVLNPIQIIIRSVAFLFNFALVGLVILYTYIKVMKVARQMTSNKSSAVKASRTVMLHAFQLLLYMTSLLYLLMEQFPKQDAEFVPLAKFFTLTCLPRFLSPVIYGIRDELLRKHMKKFYPRKLS
ncbi:odorant receptor 131-2-like [Spea bombifrons]|uniref:odorant receptor 131-2-like n=1 Tax=Spea bombifrons TaxID=233779 RepID=UPI0023499560|nr:odorant receptor 131-2-like [Spea bombifrons]